jgi:hypothetical protein
MGQVQAGQRLRFHKAFCLGSILVQAVPVPKRETIVKCRFEAVKDCPKRKDGRHFVVASPSLTASNRRPIARSCGPPVQPRQGT